MCLPISPLRPSGPPSPPWTDPLIVPHRRITLPPTATSPYETRLPTRAYPTQEDRHGRPRRSALRVWLQTGQGGREGRCVALLRLSRYPVSDTSSQTRQNILVCRCAIPLFFSFRPDSRLFLDTSHYQHLPTGPWWDVLAPRLTLIKTVVPESYLGRQISHFAHQADVLRLLAMKHSGGIYLDIDMFVCVTASTAVSSHLSIRAHDRDISESSLLTTCCISLLRWEWRPRQILDGLSLSQKDFVSVHILRSVQVKVFNGTMQNAVIISAPHSPFIDRWLASYESFDEAVWAHHSVVVPWVGVLPKRKRRNDIELTPSQSQEIARSHPDEVQVLSSRAFFWPMWHGEEIQYTHENDDYDFVSTGQYA